jgi:membrane associated rhomboid family serine protease
MKRGTGSVKSLWSGVLIAVTAMAIVSVVAVVQDWDLDSWIWAAAVCAVAGAVFAGTRVSRNRRLDSAARQVREAGSDTN